jgi:hypothetical protein
MVPNPVPAAVLAGGCVVNASCVAALGVISTVAVAVISTLVTLAEIVRTPAAVAANEPIATPVLEVFPG